MHILDNEYMLLWVLLYTSWKKWSSAHFWQWVHAMNGKKEKLLYKNNKKLKRSQHRTLTADQTKLTKRKKRILVAARSNNIVTCWKQWNYAHFGQLVYAYLGPSAVLCAKNEWFGACFYYRSQNAHFSQGMAMACKFKIREYTKYACFGHTHSQNGQIWLFSPIVSS